MFHSCSLRTHILFRMSNPNLWARIGHWLTVFSHVHEKSEVGCAYNPLTIQPSTTETPSLAAAFSRHEAFA